MRIIDFLLMSLFQDVMYLGEDEETVYVDISTDDIHINNTLYNQTLFHYCKDGHVKRLQIEPYTMIVKLGMDDGRTMYESYSIGFQELLWRKIL